MRIQTRHIINSLPLVADVLGRKYGVQVEIGGKAAMTDGRTIHIPALSLSAGEEAVRLARGYIDHESGHLRHSDFALLNKAKLTPFERYVLKTLGRSLKMAWNKRLVSVAIVWRWPPPRLAKATTSCRTRYWARSKRPRP